MNDENKMIYQQLGQMMMFCLNATQDYPIGMLFDRGIFIMLAKLQDHHAAKPLEELVKDERTLQELFSIYLAMEETNELMEEPLQRLKNWNRPFDQNTDPTILSDLYFSESCMYEERGGLDKLSENEVRENPSILLKREYREALQQVAKEKIVETVITALQPMLPGVLELAKGMQSVKYPGKAAIDFAKAQRLGPAALSERIQGQLDSKVVLDRLKFGDGIDPEKELWFREWVQSLPSDQIKRFVFALTGANAVGKTDLKIFPSADRIVFHTCFSYVDIPFAGFESKQQLAEVMATALSGEEKYNIG